MPYVPSLKTDGISQDRILLDAKVENLANEIVLNIRENFDVLSYYRQAFYEIGTILNSLQTGHPVIGAANHLDVASVVMGTEIFKVGAKYSYQGAFLGELNYSITRLIQRVPQLMVESGKWPAKDEIRYWLYACTVEALINAADRFKGLGLGISGVFEDIKDEYKRRVNTSYEAAQILKSGDCYDTPFYNRLVKIVDESGNEIGKILVDVVRSPETLGKDILDGELVLRTKGTK